MKNDVTNHRHTLHKHERIKRSKDIDHLFAEGEKIFEYPLLIWWEEKNLPTNSPAQVLVSVSKRRFRKATDRVCIKRLLREAYRKNKLPLYRQLETNGKQMLIAIIYVGKKMPAYQEIEKKIIILLHRLSQVYESRENHTE